VVWAIAGVVVFYVLVRRQASNSDWSASPPA
jgi:hypothetical protein